MSSLKSGSSGCIGLPCLCSKLAMYACNSFDGSGCMGMALIMLPVDPFGPSEVRRVERALIEEYRAMVLRALEMPSLHDAAVAIELPDLVRELLQRSEAAAEWLAFEITESDVMADAGGAIRILHNLREMGIRFAIDDFGTGYSSLAYLNRLDVDEVKIDRSFIGTMTVDASSAAIVRATIDLGHGLGLLVVAEGVEDAAILEALRALRCDLAQGFLFAKPMPAAQIEEWLVAAR